MSIQTNLNPSNNPELLECSQSLCQLLRHSAQPCLLINKEFEIFFANPAAMQLFNLPRHYRNLPLKKILPIEIRSREPEATSSHSTQKNKRQNISWRIEKAYPINSQPFYVEIAISQEIVKEQITTMLFARSTSYDHESFSLDQEKHRKLQTFVSFAPIGIFYLDARLECEYVNDAWCRLTGLSIEESMHFGWQLALNTPAIIQQIEQIASTNDVTNEIKQEIQITTPLGQTKWVLLQAQSIRTLESSDITIAGSLLDIDDLVETRKSLQKLAHQDQLTGLPNRQMFNTMIAEFMRRIHRQKAIALLFIDLNHFKQVNDRHGHSAGDAYLKICAERICHSVRKSDFVARLGGDEFTALIEEDVSNQTLSAIAENILSNLAQPLLIAGETLTPSAAIGIAICSKPNMSVNDFIKQADEAMYQAKNEPGPAFAFFSPEDNKLSTIRSHIIRTIPKALSNNELEIWYQQQQSVANDRLSGWEALLRWRQKDVGSIAPSLFIPVLESTQIIHPVTHWLLEQVVKKASELERRERFIDPHISFNISAQSVRDKLFIPLLKEFLSEYQVPGNLLTCEITESVMLNDFDRARKFVAELQDLGVLIALDDFGTGYCSLLYLRKFPIDWIKIDRHFVQGMVMQKEDRTIVKTIINLAHNLDMKVVGEGVETALQLKMLKQLNCDYYQGYLTSRPPEFSLGQD